MSYGKGDTSETYQTGSTGLSSSEQYGGQRQGQGQGQQGITETDPSSGGYGEGQTRGRETSGMYGSGGGQGETLGSSGTGTYGQGAGMGGTGLGSTGARDTSWEEGERGQGQYGHTQPQSGMQGEHHKPGIGEKMRGGMEKVAGKMSNKPELVERGQERSVHRPARAIFGSEFLNGHAPSAYVPNNLGPSMFTHLDVPPRPIFHF
ncbi:hypothetical protein D9615_006692 [Tricholomella constricta]|uniref:Uncharacterized protein n=1 Tax=Tricholomella constricta TaxID=117010 RepID=A0A8H5M1K5_9AGAR|nr:hypothetical protein D9615_006692 [Tricholomella constricta]